MCVSGYLAVCNSTQRYKGSQVQKLVVVYAWLQNGEKLLHSVLQASERFVKHAVIETTELGKFWGVSHISKTECNVNVSDRVQRNRFIHTSAGCF